MGRSLVHLAVEGKVVMKLFRTLLASVLVLTVSSSVLAQAQYYPPPGEWERKAPEEVGMDSTLSLIHI